MEAVCEVVFSYQIAFLEYYRNIYGSLLIFILCKSLMLTRILLPMVENLSLELNTCIEDNDLTSDEG